MAFKIFGIIPKQHPAESSQFERILKILKDSYIKYGDWAYIILDIPYDHEKSNVLDVDYNWNGQIDILLLMNKKIVVYELKGFTAKILKGKSDNDNWEIITRVNGRLTVKSYFNQASRSRAFILSDYLLGLKNRINGLDDNHWVVDARVVLKNNSDTSGFIYRIPRTIYSKDLDDILENIESSSDRELLAKYYSGIEPGTGKLHSIIVSKNEFYKVNIILSKFKNIVRTDKWFKLISENSIGEDLSECGSDRFVLDQKTAELIASELSTMKRRTIAST